MKQAPLFWAAVFVLSLALVAPAGAAQREMLHGHVPEAVSRLQAVGRLPATNRLALAIGLPLRNKESLTNLLQQIYDPASTNYHRYLTPEEIAERFGPTEQDYQAVISFAETNGLTVTSTHPNRLLLDANGSVADIEKAFQVNLRLYPHPTEGRTFYAPDVEPSVDTGVPMLDISGLNNFTLPHPKNLVRIPADRMAQATPASGSGPSGNYMGNDFRAAYAPGVSLTGAGQTVGLVQFDGYYTNDIATYETQAGLPYITLQNVLLDGYNGVPTTGANSGNAEVSLDIEMTISMAPGLSKVIVYEAGPNGIPNDVLNRMLTDNLAKQLSCSWGWGGGPDASADQIFQLMAAQGQSFFDASGDSDAFSGSTSSDFPSDDPYITQVGGTTLTTTGPGGSYVSETVWNWGLDSGSYVGSSGGISTSYSIPSWQQGLNMSASQGSTTMRNLPDVALTADNIWVIYGKGKSGSYGGTSCAAPLWAGFTALINQQAAAAGKSTVGFVNPAIYAIGKGSSYASNFHDITTGNNTNTSSANLFFAVPGYDLCTGWGTPAGQNLINALAPLVNAPVIIISGTTLLAESFTPTNGAIDPGETAQVGFALQNIGTLNTTNLVVTLLATNGVTAPSGPQTYGVLSTNGTIISQPFTFTAVGMCGGTITATLQLQDGASNLGTVTTTFPLGQFVTIFSENFDGVTAPALPSGWATSTSGAQSLWTTTNSTPDTAPNAAYSPDPAAVGLNELDSPAVALPTGQTQLTFRNSYDLESSSGTTAYDGGVLEIKIGAGLWTDILTAGGGFASNGYNRTISSSYQNPLAGRQAWSGNSGGYITTTVNLPAAAAGQTIQLRWRCGTDNSVSKTGWRIDTVAIKGYVCSVGSVADLAIGQLVSPNPLNLGSNLTCAITVTNLGPNAASAVVVTDALPAGLTFVSATTSQGAWANNSGVISFALGTLNSSATASITIAANASTAGAWTNTATVSSATSDPVSANNSAPASISVNSPPTISAIPNVATNENAVAGPVAFTIGDAETPASALTLAAASSNTNLVPTANIVFGGSGSNRTVTITPALNQFGSATITVTVSDGLATASASFVLTINCPPTLAPVPNQTIAVGMTLTITNAANDPDGDRLTFSLGAGAAANARINATNGVFTWTPTNGQTGISNFTVIVTDSGLPPLSATQSFAVTVVPSNHLPALVAIPNQTIAVGMTLTITNLASDPDSPPQALTFSLGAGAAANASINSTNGVFTWTPNGGQIGTSNFTVVVTDNGLPPLSATQSFAVTVVPSNNPPVLAAIADRTIHAGSTLWITNSASDPDSPPQVLAFSLGGGAPASAAIDPTSGLFDWTPGDADAGTTNSITVVVTDNGLPPLKDAKSFAVTVMSRPTFESVTLSDNVVTLTWSAIAGQNYQVEFNTDLSSTNWTNLGGPISATNETATASDTIGSDSQRLYRIILVP